MTITEIPLTPDNQLFDISINNSDYKMRIIWRESGWFLDLQNSDGGDIIAGIPLVTGADLVAQYAYLQLGFGLWLFSDSSGNTAPDQYDLGYTAHLCIITEAA
ncbi:hypothetical protein QZH36_18375 [Erwinia sp. BC051422]|uniref:phage baseplate plug family protein n=1 Tax=Erwinia wuhanensis TaxID=3045167 RepID=UPI00264B61E3|nr:hypothetical protein [Erwinia sp. BC051422]MDN8543373.1 hypothetical protein [Erwinia sp. BC051422]